MKIKINGPEENLPPGKATIKHTIYGWKGYIGRVKWISFEDEIDANIWLKEMQKKGR